MNDYALAEVHWRAVWKVWYDRLQECTNPFETNANLDECSNAEKVEATKFKQIVGSLRYICNSKLDICFAEDTWMIIGNLISQQLKEC